VCGGGEQVVKGFVSTGARRFAVVDVSVPSSFVLRGLITQTTILEYLSSHADLLGSLGALPATDLLPPLPGPPADGAEGTPARPAVITVGATETAVAALTTLVSHKVWGAPVVDASGAIVANFSVSDVRHLASVTNQADADAALALPVLEFLRTSGGGGRGPSPSLTPVVVSPSDSVSMVVELLAASKLHHVYVVDADRRPTGVVSLTDVMRALAASIAL
jgi:CBS domain-containing protein